ncbi:MAG: hypothetical protein ACHQNA_11715 [Acidimicrobiales bacterium]
MAGSVGRGVLALSGMGFPLTQLAIRRLGRGGAALVEVVCGGLLARDASMLAMGAPSRLRRGPALLLWLETLVGVVAVVAGLRPLLDEAARGRTSEPRPDAPEGVRRAAIGLLFGLHTMRFRIYLQPAHGRRPTAS